MVITWRIRYLDRSDRKFKDRDLYLVTSRLDPVTRAAVELFMETKTNRTERDAFRFRHLFTERNNESLESMVIAEGKMEGILLAHYIEDENGKELSGRDLGEILTGNPENELLPVRLEKHDLELRKSGAPPIPVAEVVLSDEQIKVLGYFCRDLRELAGSVFFTEERPATLRYGGKLSQGESVVETPASDDEIRSFVTIFRRLGLTDEPANFAKAAAAFAAALNGHPYGNWIAGEAESYKSKLNDVPTFSGFGPSGPVTFTRKRLIEVFVYTQYAHQPDDLHKKLEQQRERQFAECLQEVGGRKSQLTWLFLSELWFAAREINSAGRVIAGWFDKYSQHHNLTPDILNSLLHEHPGIGTIEKEADKRARILGEKTKELAAKLWEAAGSPPSGPVHFLHEAHERITTVLRGAQTTR